MRDPYESANDGTIHSIALAQLSDYQAMATYWPRYPDGRAIRCGKCDQALWFSHDITGNMYVYTDDEKIALIVAHIRQRHIGDNHESN